MEVVGPHFHAECSSFHFDSTSCSLSSHVFCAVQPVFFVWPRLLLHVSKLIELVAVDSVSNESQDEGTTINFQLGFDATKSMLNVLLRYAAKVTSKEESGPKLFCHA